MRESLVNSIFVVFLVAALLLAGCGEKVQSGLDEPLFNESANEALEEAADSPSGFVEFMFNYTPRVEAKYELAEDDVFSLSNENFSSDDISVFGVMLGDSYDKVIEIIGIPDTIEIASDQSYKNVQYRKKIGVSGSYAALSFNVKNDTVDKINIGPLFDKYLSGNTSFGVERSLMYSILGIPDYQDFVDSYRVYHYIEKGVDVYFRADKSAIYSFYEPKEFKGVKYVTRLENMGNGIFANVTEAVLIE